MKIIFYKNKQDKLGKKGKNTAYRIFEAVHFTLTKRIFAAWERWRCLCLLDENLSLSLSTLACHLSNGGSKIPWRSHLTSVFLSLMAHSYMESLSPCQIAVANNKFQTSLPNEGISIVTMPKPPATWRTAIGWEDEQSLE